MIATVRRPERFLVAAACLLLAAMLAQAVLGYITAPNASLIDFRAFYCGARVAALGVDPYLAQPLFHCEAQLQIAGYPAGGVGIPAPLPEAMFLLLAPLAALPYAIAAGLWLAILLAAILATTVLLADLTGLPNGLVFASIGLGEGYAAFGTGNMAPLAVLAIVTAAWLLQRRRYAGASLAAALALLEPHLGIPAAAALFIWVPQARRWTLAFAAIVGLASLIYLGPHSPLEYVLHVLPVQASAEAYAWNQYSLTFLLTSFGLDPTLASRIGSVFFIAAAAFALISARAVSHAVCSRAAIILFPIAVAMFGGPYVHFAQVIAALPFALLLYARHRTMPTFAAVVALSIPGYALLMQPATSLLLVIATAAIMAAGIPGLSRRGFFYVVGTTAAAAFTIAFIASAAIHGSLPSLPASTSVSGLASETWREICWSLRVRPQVPLLALVSPVWAALAIVIVRPYLLRRRRIATAD